MNAMLERLKTVTPAVLSAWNEDGSFDEASYRALVQRCTDAGMKSLFILGYTGEVKYITREERKVITAVTRDQAPDSLIVAGCVGPSIDDILMYIADAAEAGADMALVTPTEFFSLRERELESMFVELNEKTKLPIMIYNCPENPHHLSGEMLNRLAKLPNIQALKQSTTTDKIQRIINKMDKDNDFIMVSGDEFEFFPAICLGVEGFIMGAPGNITPGLCLEMFNDYNEGRFEVCREKYLKFADFYDELFFCVDNDVIAITKATMELAGVCKRWMKHPTASVSDEDMEVIKDVLARHHIAL
ncbi:MAG: dihydrodipicolinate synthase family protein [Lachnospiraceae bacterium]|nr:dihydrodipicolinate synthase family protein [Lachnospiraceae bacterium]